MALHESQALIIESQIGRGDAFLGYATPIVQRPPIGEPTTAAEWQSDNLGRIARKVGCDLIRTDADEVTYPLHILLRYKLETALVSGDLTVTDLLQVWNDEMVLHFGLSSGDDHANGCMQNVHWFDGSFGYFPTYALGAMIAARLYGAAEASITNLNTAIGKGELGVLIDWLRTHAHRLGRTRSTAEIVADATGSPLGPSALLAYLKSRYC